MTDQQLQCFVCVADKLNFTKAAETLYISTPTVTHHIKKLEEELHTVLFIRTSRMVKLTQAGTSFYNDAKDILAKMDMSKKRVKKMASQHISFLRIGCSSTTELAYMERFLCEMQKKYPQVYPQITINDYFSLKNLFNNKLLDIVFASKEMSKDMQECSFKKIKDVINYAIIGKQSPLNTEERIEFEDLQQECLITLHPKFVPFHYGDKLQEKITLYAQSHFNIACENDQAAILLAKSGYGVAIVPEFCVPIHLHDVCAIPIANEGYTSSYGIAYHKQQRISYIDYFLNNFQIG